MRIKWRIPIDADIRFRIQAHVLGQSVYAAGKVAVNSISVELEEGMKVSQELENSERAITGESGCEEQGELDL